MKIIKKTFLEILNKILRLSRKNYSESISKKDKEQAEDVLKKIDDL
ncbi:hypothetical protein GF354_06650 [Candidatus Peregrinibacteria bacterium]|nr:hypothetical protein [Candidatus Peregrinibacteria bacterium]